MSDNTPKPKARVFLESRYRKLVRGLPQTVFFCPVCKGNRRKRQDCERCEGFGKLTKDSVQELLSRRLVPAFKSKMGKFHGAGREDVDVLMLGRGRPFVFEIIDARRTEVDLEDLLERFHAIEGERVQIAPFKFVDRARVGEMKEEQHEKRYRLDVALEAAVPASVYEPLVGQRLEIVQRTPQRVSHRRADLERERWVVVEALRETAPQRLELEILCMHGTYVKEWVSSDEGRTKNSLAERLSTGAVCECLDVLEVLTSY